MNGVVGGGTTTMASAASSVEGMRMNWNGGEVLQDDEGEGDGGVVNW